VQPGQNAIDHFDLSRKLAGVTLGAALYALAVPLERLCVGEHQFQRDYVHVLRGAEFGSDVRNLTVLETAHHHGNRVYGPNV